jgi:hypothetical protein
MFRLFRLFWLLRAFSHGTEKQQSKDILLSIQGCTAAMSGCSGFCTNSLTEQKVTRGKFTLFRLFRLFRLFANFLRGQSFLRHMGNFTSSTDEEDDDFLAREPVDGISKHAQHPANQHLVAVEDVPEERHRYGGWKVEPLKRRRTRFVNRSTGSTSMNPMPV